MQGHECDTAAFQPAPDRRRVPVSSLCAERRYGAVAFRHHSDTIVVGRDTGDASRVRSSGACSAQPHEHAQRALMVARMVRQAAGSLDDHAGSSGPRRRAAIGFEARAFVAVLWA